MRQMPGNLRSVQRGDDIFAKRPGLFEQHQRNGFTLRQYVIRGAVPQRRRGTQRQDVKFAGLMRS